jgi:hypothetical protein
MSRLHAVAAHVLTVGFLRRRAQENRGRCFSCRKKVGLLGFECR